MADIFLSYARPDREKIAAISSALEGEGYTVWWDKALEGGSRFALKIEAELVDASAVIVAWSQYSKDSVWVADEASIGRDSCKLVPIALDPSPPPLGFRQFQSIAFNAWDGSSHSNEFTALRNAIDRTINNDNTEDRIACSNTSNRTPWVAVFPFASLSLQKDQEYFADGLTEDIIAALSTNKQLTVISRAATTPFKGTVLNPVDAANNLGARYIVSGSVRKMHEYFRVSVEFLSVDTGAQIWANRYDIPAEVILSISDEIVEKISASLGAHMSWAETDRIDRIRTTDLNAWEYFQKALGMCERGPSIASRLNEVFDLLERAIKADPEYGYAHAFMSWLKFIVIIYGLYEEDELPEIMYAATNHLERARELAKGDPFCLTWVAASECYSGRYERAVEILSDVTRINPGNIYALYILSMALAQLGDSTAAHNTIDRARTLAPDGGFGLQYNWFKGYIYFLSGEYKEAIDQISKHVEMHPDYGFSRVLLAIALVRSGREDDAKIMLKKAINVNPQLTAKKFELVLLAQPNRSEAALDIEILNDYWPDQN
ncbi:MAG: TIR domain-containing protein [Marinicaulis sp.]|nr:TIR domain-containing protein [Marinicaulis sp.]